METLSYTRLKDFMRCPRLHLYAWVMRREPLHKSNALWFGDYFGRSLEQWELNRGDPPEGIFQMKDPNDWALRCASDKWHELFLGDDHPLTEHHLMMGEVLLRGYHAAYWEDGLETLGTEVRWELPLVNPATNRPSRTFRVKGYFDAVVRDSKGRIWVKERKTSGEDITLGSTYWERLRANAQASMYFDAAQRMGYDIEGVLFDVVRKTSSPKKATPVESRKYTKGKLCRPCKGFGEYQRPGSGLWVTCKVCKGSKYEEEPRLYKGQREHDETPKEYFQRISKEVLDEPTKHYVRGNIVRLKSEVDAARRDTWGQAEMMRKSLKVGSSPRNTGACFQYGRRCAYYEVCFGSVNILDETRFKTRPKSSKEEPNGNSEKQGDKEAAATTGATRT